MKTTFFTLIIALSSLTTIAQDIQNVDFEFLPSEIHFDPLKTNYDEARLGILYYPKDGNLKVDIGNNIDLLAFHFPKISGRLTLSIEFMAYALSTNYAGNRLQIDALDGFFGGNAAFSKDYKKGQFISRFRIIHNSAHFVDGHYDIHKGEWINNTKPIPFTRDFGEITLGYKFFTNFGILRTYGTASYATLIRPTELKKWNGYVGFELANNKIIKDIFEHETNLFVSSQLNIEGNPKYQFNSNSMLGIKFGEWEKKGIVFYISYYRGSNPLSEYYKNRVSQFGLGFIVDFN